MNQYRITFADNKEFDISFNSDSVLIIQAKNIAEVINYLESEKRDISLITKIELIRYAHTSG